MRKADAKDYKAYSKKILKICLNKLVSLEVFADDYLNMLNKLYKLTLGKKCLCKSTSHKLKRCFYKKNY
jgi:transaldolase